MTRFAILLTALAVGCIPSAGQDGGGVRQSSRFGVDASFELTIPSGSHGDWDTGSGAYLSGYYKLPLAAHWDFRPALGVYYSTMGADYEYADGSVYDATVKNVGIRVPLMVGYHFTPANGLQVDVATGPWLNFNLFARQYAMPDAGAPVAVPRSISLFDRGFKRVEALWGLVLSVTFKEHYTVGITTGVAFTPLASFGNRDNKIRVRRNTIALSLGYNF